MTYLAGLSSGHLVSVAVRDHAAFLARGHAAPLRHWVCRTPPVQRPDVGARYACERMHSIIPSFRLFNKYHNGRRTKWK